MSLPSEFINKVVGDIPRRVKAVKEAKGKHIAKD